MRPKAPKSADSGVVEELRRLNDNIERVLLFYSIPPLPTEAEFQWAETNKTLRAEEPLSEFEQAVKEHCEAKGIPWTRYPEKG